MLLFFLLALLVGCLFFLLLVCWFFLLVRACSFVLLACLLICSPVLAHLLARFLAHFLLFALLLLLVLLRFAHMLALLCLLARSLACLFFCDSSLDGSFLNGCGWLACSSACPNCWLAPLLAALPCPRSLLDRWPSYLLARFDWSRCTFCGARTRPRFGKT